ncbi:MAG: ECF transporter S component [Eubacterium sp.]|nr:ECF transporter S component [Eubacterium sp.]MBR4241230.1 ECF transporter S component [Eubacterium sp.]MBR7060479.1 ECF transporter S component [Eubacterium sp.]
MSAKNNSKTRFLAGAGMLSAAAIALQYLEVPIPIIPSFIKLDFSDLPALIGAFAYGPIAGILISLVKNLIHMAVSQSGYIGELSNFILGAVFSATAGIIYKKDKSKKGAFLGGVIGALLMAAVSYPSNEFIVYPFYYNFMDKNAVLGMYQAILPSVKSIEQALLIFNVPFTFIKGMICVCISMLIYKPLSPILHGKNK